MRAYPATSTLTNPSAPNLFRANSEFRLTRGTPLSRSVRRDRELIEDYVKSVATAATSVIPSRDKGL